MTVKPPPHDLRIKGKAGVKTRPIGAVVHTTEMAPRKGTASDRHDIIDFLARNGKSVPVVCDPGTTGIRSTLMTPLGYLGYAHAGGLTGKAWGIEQVGFARWTRAEWLKPGKREMVREAAHWGAWVLAVLMDLPVTERNLRRFIVGHDRDDKLGGTSDHWDPGPGYPWDLFRADAMAYAGERMNEDDFRYRLVATRDDEKRIRTFRPAARRRAYRRLRKWVARGWRVVIRKQPLPHHEQPEV